MIRRRGAVEEERESSSEEEDAFSALSRKSHKNKKKQRVEQETDEKTTTTASAKQSEASSNALDSSAKPIVPSTTSSMKRHHGAMSDTRKRKMDALIHELKRKPYNSEPSQSAYVPDKKGSYVQPGEEKFTTNIFVGNLSPSLTEEEVTDLFRQFGDLYSVKIMWPRTAEERSRNRHTGFVCYMNRADAEDAMKTCNETDPFNVGRKITMRWGKNVRHNNNTVAPIPRAPRRIPHRSQAETTTVATSADTTNAIRVTVPRNPQRAKFLSTVASFVAKDGVAAENYLLRQEAKNPDFKFLLYETSDSETVRQEHIYYRWRVYSFSQGDSREVWRTEPFRMARKGRFWIPPPLDGALQLEHQASQEDRRLEQDSQRRRRRRNTPADGQDSLSQADHLQLVVLTRKKLCASRDAICNAMAFCLEHSGACGEICSFLKSLLLEDKCSVDTRVSRLYLISDILFNSQQPGIKNAFRYRDAVEKMAPDVFTSLGQHGRNSKNLGRMTLNKLNNAVTAVLGAWARWSVYNPMFLEELDARFHGREIVKEAPPEDAIKEEEPEEANKAEPPPPIILDRPRGDWTEVNDDEEEEQGHKEESSQLVPTETKEGAKDESPVSEDAQKVADGDSGKDSQNKKESSEDSATEPKPAATDEELDDDIDGVPIEDGDLDEEGLKALETIQETLKRWAEDGEVLPEEPEEEDDGGTVNVHPADGAKPPHETAQGELASSVTPEDSKPAPTSHPADSVETTAGVL